MMDSSDLRQKFLDFFKSKGHVIIPSSSLVPENDPSVLLTTAGMQQFKPYYTSAADPLKDNHLSLGKPLGSKSVATVQKSFRTSDIDEVGDNTHLTFFEMLGNFSFGGYGKKEAIEYAYEFITGTLGLTIDYVSVFAGEGNVPTDLESENIWKSIDGKLKIVRSGRADNFWGPTGDQGPCGPTTEIYVNGVEIWNIVFNEFYQNADKSLTKLDRLGIDTGMGLERLAAVVQNVPTVFDTDLLKFLIDEQAEMIPEESKRIIADHARAIVFLISDGVVPSNKEAGYILRRILRRFIVKRRNSTGDIFTPIVNVINYYKKFYELDDKKIVNVFKEEYERFEKTLNIGIRELEKIEVINAANAFDLFQSYGLPYEVIKDISGDKSAHLKRADFDKEFAKHQDVSRVASAGMFKGGLVDHESQTIKHHTAHHLLLAALRQVLGNHVLQRGSNVSSDRLRIDFSHPAKMTDEEKNKVEQIVNEAIRQDLDVKREEMPKAEAEKLGALAEFGTKYGDVVSVYSILNKDGTVFSREFCGGPHVTHTGELGSFKILKEEAVAAGIRRIKAKAE